MKPVLYLKGIIQRRIELWGEFGRIYDIRRLKQGFRRTADMGWPSSALIAGTDTGRSGSYAWVLLFLKRNLMVIRTWILAKIRIR